jgi:hypothetical protein
VAARFFFFALLIIILLLITLFSSLFLNIFVPPVLCGEGASVMKARVEDEFFFILSKYSNQCSGITT